MKEFMVAANDTGLKVFNILELSSVLTIHNAHSDNIKKVSYLSGDMILSASSDRTVKLWDLRNSESHLGVFKLPHGVEDFCQLPTGELVIANGPVLSILKVKDSKDGFERVADY